MDLRKEVNSIMRKWGYDILLQRRVKNSNRGIYSLRENSGFSDKLEKHTVRSRYPSRGVGNLTRAIDEQMEGKIADADMVYYFSWDANPDTGDRIYEKNPNGYQTYVIDWSLPMRFHRGRIEYWIVGVTMETQQHDGEQYD